MPRLALALAPLALLSACGGGEGDNSAAPAAAGPVAAVAPPAGQSWTEVVSATPEGGYRMGNPNAPLKLVEYGSRTCPVCGVFGREGQRPLEERYVSTGKVSYEFREFLVHGQPDIPAALLGRCGGAAPFFPLLEQMYIEQGQIEEKMASAEGQALFRAMQGQSPQTIANRWADFLGYVDFVKKRGIPEAKARACLNDAKELDRITKVMQDASDNKNVGGTPTFFLNDRQLDNVVNWQQLETRLKAAGA